MLRAIHRWLPAWLARPAFREPVTDVLFAICDHFEPLHRTDLAGALARVREWRDRYPKVVAEGVDADGFTARHTFFYPIEQYDSKLVEEVARLARDTGGEIEFHLHHDGATAAALRAQLEQARDRFLSHGALCRDAAGGVRYGFVHGNWALADSGCLGRHCGVRDELRVLRETGCYADFTMPSAPDGTQTRKINSLYYSGVDGRKPHDRGKDVRAARTARLAEDHEHLLLVQGPLGLNWRRRKYGLLPRLENADLTGANPPTSERFHIWRKAGVCVVGRPEWLFVKLHTHGAHPNNSRMLLGPEMAGFHRSLSGALTAGEGIRLHYVTAREMVNILHAAEEGHVGDAGKFRNFRYRNGPD